MLPPLVRRCPECGRLRPSFSWASVSEDGRRLVECPVCGHRHEPVDDPWLA